MVRMHYAFKIGIDINIKFWLMWLIRKGFNHSLINYELLITYKSWMHFVQTLKVMIIVIMYKTGFIICSDMIMIYTLIIILINISEIGVI